MLIRLQDVVKPLEFKHSKSDPRFKVNIRAQRAPSAERRNSSRAQLKVSANTRIISPIPTASFRGLPTPSAAFVPPPQDPPGPTPSAVFTASPQVLSPASSPKVPLPVPSAALVPPPQDPLGPTPSAVFAAYPQVLSPASSPKVPPPVPSAALVPPPQDPPGPTPSAVSATFPQVLSPAPPPQVPPPVHSPQVPPPVPSAAPRLPLKSSAAFALPAPPEPSTLLPSSAHHASPLHAQLPEVSQTQSQVPCPPFPPQQFQFQFNAHPVQWQHPFQPEASVILTPRSPPIPQLPGAYPDIYGDPNGNTISLQHERHIYEHQLHAAVVPRPASTVNNWSRSFSNLRPAQWHTSESTRCGGALETQQHPTPTHFGISQAYPPQPAHSYFQAAEPMHQHAPDGSQVCDVVR
ncbi:hypothetical protein A0H81_10608 [Grifola frondosa]|uniref:Uncharacterized protein n=1 Tax=Grifola frondosa TaxID=5627 RepID=A0A1C7LXJ9_GRIFR|nr:hypothetical protein A0H81_10608 [Grifola frondosa]